MIQLAFLDSSVFIWGYNRPKSNSVKILKLMNEGEIKVVISEKVIDELRKYFINYYNKDVWSKVLRHITTIAVVILRDEIGDEIKRWRGKINDKDLEHLATVKYLGLRYLVSYDRDFESIDEYITPKKFIKKLGMKEANTEY